MSKKKKSSQAAAQTPTVAPVEPQVQLQTQPTINPIQAKTNTLTSRPDRARGFFAQQASTAKKYLLGG